MKLNSTTCKVLRMNTVFQFHINYFAFIPGLTQIICLLQDMMTCLCEKNTANKAT